MIDVENLVYDYPTGRALHRVSFVVRSGAVLALVGPNGAGKSTLMRCMAALDAPSEGVVTVLGLDTRRQPRQVHAALGYLADSYGLYDALTVERALTYAARSRGVPAAQAPAAVAAASARVGLEDRLGQLAGALSRGLRQRLAIAQSIVHRPRVLLLDEPAAGLDPDARRSLSGLIRDLAADEMTVVVSSHILSELEDYCTEMLMLDEGRVVGDGVVRAGAPLWRAARDREAERDAHAASRAEEGRPAVAPATVEVMRVELVLAAASPELAARLQALGLEVETATADRAVIVAPAAEVERGETLARLVGAGLAVRSFSPLRPSLEDAYMAARAEAARRAATAVPVTSPLEAGPPERRP